MSCDERGHLIGCPFPFALLRQHRTNTSAAGWRVSPIRAGWKTGNTQRIPLFSKRSAEEKSLATGSCRIVRCCLNFEGGWAAAGYPARQRLLYREYGQNRRPTTWACLWDRPVRREQNNGFSSRAVGRCFRLLRQGRHWLKLQSERDVSFADDFLRP